MLIRLEPTIIKIRSIPSAREIQLKRRKIKVRIASAVLLGVLGTAALFTSDFSDLSKASGLKSETMETADDNCPQNVTKMLSDGTVKLRSDSEIREMHEKLGRERYGMIMPVITIERKPNISTSERFEEDSFDFNPLFPVILVKISEGKVSGSENLSDNRYFACLYRENNGSNIWEGIGNDRQRYFKLNGKNKVKKSESIRNGWTGTVYEGEEAGKIWKQMQEYFLGLTFSITNVKELLIDSIRPRSETPKNPAQHRAAFQE